MSFGWVCALIAFLGGVGGIANCLIAREFALPKYDRDAKVWNPGWIGNVLVGAIAAPVAWIMEGTEIFGQDLSDLLAKGVHVTIGSIAMSIVIGVGGGRILTLSAEKQAERVSTNNLAAALESQETTEAANTGSS
jgi:hypothetical protein